MQLAFYTSSRHEAKFEVSNKATHVSATFTCGFPAAGNEVDESGKRELNNIHHHHIIFVAFCLWA